MTGFFLSVGTTTHFPGRIHPLERAQDLSQENSVDLIFLVSTITGVAAAAFITLILLLIAMGKVDV